jgi:hypothetical protein
MKVSIHDANAAAADSRIGSSAPAISNANVAIGQASE